MMCDKFIVRPVPIFDNLREILNSLDDMAAKIGTKKFDLLQYFDTSDLSVMKEKFLGMMDEYEDGYGKVGREVERFTTR